MTPQAGAWGVRLGQPEVEEVVSRPSVGRAAGGLAASCGAAPLVIVLDNYSVHKSEAVPVVQPEWAAANVELWYLPASAPERSAIEPVWHSVKHHERRERSYPLLGGLKGAVDASLARKAIALRSAHPQSADSLRPAA